MDAGQVTVVQQHLGDLEAVDLQEVGHAGRQAGLLQQRHRLVGGQRLGRGRLQTTALPISAGAVGRLPAIAVKLNGVIA